MRRSVLLAAAILVTGGCSSGSSAPGGPPCCSFGTVLCACDGQSDPATGGSFVITGQGATCTIEKKYVKGGTPLTDTTSGGMPAQTCSANADGG